MNAVLNISLTSSSNFNFYYPLSAIVIIITTQPSMFKRINQEQLKKHPKDIGSGKLNKLRILDSIPLKQINDSYSAHTSIMSQSRHSSIKNLPNVSMASSEFSMRSSLLKSKSTEKKKVQLNKEQTVEQLLEKYYNRPFTKSLVQYLNKDWAGKLQQFWKQKKIKNFVESINQRSNWIREMIDEFLQKEYTYLGTGQREVLMSLLFKETINSIQDLQSVIPEIIKKIPDERLYYQQTILEELTNKLGQIYDPKCLYSNAKIKERMHLYLEQYTIKKNTLKADLCPKLEVNMKFLDKMQDYLATYQHEIIKLKSQNGALQIEKNKIQQLLDRKSHFVPLNVDYDRLYQMKAATNKQIRNDLESNIVQFHQEKHKRNTNTITQLQKGELILREQNDVLKQQIQQLQNQISSWNKNRPQFRDSGVQVFLLSKGKGSEGSGGAGSSLMVRFLDNVVTPFSFNRQIAGSLINILSIDKILYDYELIRLRQSLKSFEQFMFEWFIIRTGCRRIAQIFVKNFIYSLKQLRNSHKRFSIFYRICGHSGFKRRNIQQDLQGIFFTTHLCWSYLIRLAMMYRKRLNQNPTGYHLFPPLPCEDVFKLPLRKVYQLVEQFLVNQQIQVPNDLTQKIDHYCINEISKFKSNDPQFQKQILEQIHILRDINFDLIAGFLLEYIANMRCQVVQKLLRTIDAKQKQDGNILGYSQFETIYRRYYKERRAKIEQIYAKLCMVNQHDMLDIQNMQPVVLAILEDQAPLRAIFEKVQSLKVLILSEKQSLMRNQKKPMNPNSYENFRQRYYHEFYDFYNTTAFLEEVFKIIKVLVKKRLKRAQINNQKIEKLVDGSSVPVTPQIQNSKKSGFEQGQDDQSEDAESNHSQKQASLKNQDEIRSVLVSKIQEWNKIMIRVPHFTPKVLTIDQIVIHNIRRKQMIDASEFAWRTLRQILINLGKQ